VSIDWHIKTTKVFFIKLSFKIGLRLIKTTKVFFIKLSFKIGLRLIKTTKVFFIKLSFKIGLRLILFKYQNIKSFMNTEILERIREKRELSMLPKKDIELAYEQFAK